MAKREGWALLFSATAAWCLERQPQLQFVMPAPNAERRVQIEAIWRKAGLSTALTLLDGQHMRRWRPVNGSDRLLARRHWKAMLSKRPMVVRLTVWLI